MNYDERYEVRNSEAERALRTIAARIEEDLPDGWAVGLFLVPFGANEAAPKGKGAVFWIAGSRIRTSGGRQMDMRTGHIHDSRLAALAVGARESDIAPVQVFGGITVESGPFKGRVYEIVDGRRGRRRKDLEGRPVSAPGAGEGQ